MIIIMETPVFRTLGSQHIGALLTTYHNGQAHILIMHTLYTHTLCKHSHTQHGHTCVSCSTLTVRSGGGVGDNLLAFIYNKSISIMFHHLPSLQYSLQQSYNGAEVWPLMAINMCAVSG